MFQRNWKVVVFDRDTKEIIHARSTFVHKQDAIDRAWDWHSRGHSVRIIDRANSLITDLMLQDYADGLPV